MHSPVPSPTVRTIAHASRNGSYFSLPPHQVVPSRRHSVSIRPESPSAYHSAGSPLATEAGRSGQILVGCLKNSPKPAAMASPDLLQGQDYFPTMPIQPHREYQSVRARPPVNRRTSLRESAIPLCPTSPSAKQAQLYSRQPLASPRQYPQEAPVQAEVGRRRPSFKIDLPPRPQATDLLDGRATAGITPFAAPVPASAASTPYYAPQTHGKHPSTPYHQPEMQDEEGEYIILQGRRSEVPSRHGDPAAGYFPASQPPEHDSPFGYNACGVVGLGYSLNKLRAPTPWVRPSGEDGEWLSAKDVEDVELRMRTLGAV